MTPAELYDLLDREALRYEIVEIFEGVRIIRVQVDEEQTDTLSESSEGGNND